MEDALYFKIQEQQRGSDRRYKKKSSLASAIRQLQKKNNTWANNTLCNELLKIVKTAKVNSLKEAVYLLAEKKVSQTSFLGSDSSTVRKMAVEQKAGELLDTLYGINDQERNSLKEEDINTILDEVIENGLQINVTLDDKTCSQCKSLQGSVIDMLKNPLPHHPNCRCTVKPVSEISGYVSGTIVSVESDGKALVSFVDDIHMILDLGGLLPGAGAAPDLVNGLIYLAEGDFVNALWSGGSAIPLLGLLTGSLKIVKKGVKVVDVISDGSKKVKLKLSDGSTIDYPTSSIMNYKYAGKTYYLTGDLAKKYPNGVKFSKKGFPDFSPYSIKRVAVEGMNGDRRHDARLANKAAGYAKTPDGYIWHHVEDGINMELVPKDLHETVKHTGGAAFINAMNKK